MFTSRAWIRIVYTFMGCAAATVASALPPLSPHERIEAVWKVQQIRFRYGGEQTVYTCRALRQKLERILKALGAHEHMRLQQEVCDDLGRGHFVLVLASPVEATEENIRKITTYSAEQILIARTRGVRLPAAEDLERFPAHWKTVSFARDRSLRLSPGDCELVRELNRQVLPHLQVQVMDDNLYCRDSSFFKPRLTVAALTAVESAD